MIGRAVLFLIGAASLAAPAASDGLNCTVPDNLPEGYAACYRCEVREETTDEVIGYKTETVLDIDGCKEFLGRFGVSATDYLCTAMNFYKTKEIGIFKTVEVCTCDSKPIMENHIDPNLDAFVIESPKQCSKYPSNIICQWNLPEADQVYMHLLKQDIEGNPNDDETGCEDKLIVSSEDLDGDVVTCGTLPITRPATKIYNSIYNSVPSVFFVSDDEDERSGFQMLLVYLNRKQQDMQSTGASSEVPLGVTIDAQCPPAFTPFTTCCQCPQVNVTQLCPNGSLAKNVIFQKLSLEIENPSSSCPGIGETGFSGLKGCIGAEYLSGGNLTEEECVDMSFGMTELEVAAFMDRGSSLWCDCSSPSSSTFCMTDVPATRPNAKELIKLEELLAGHGNATQCAASDNAVLRIVGDVYLKSQQVPVLDLSDGSRC